MRWRSALVVCLVLGGAFTYSAQTVLTDRQKIDQALLLLSTVQPVSSTGWSNLANIRTRLNTLKTQVAQDPATCTYSISPIAQTAPVLGGSGGTTVTTQAGCAWTAVSNSVPWLTVSGNAAGTGTAFVGMTASANAGAARTGTVTVGGQTFTVTQPGVPIAACNDSLDNDGDNLIDLADPGCSSSSDTDETNAAPPPPPPPPPPSGDVLFRLDCGPNGERFPSCGSSGVWETPGAFTKRYAGAGSTGAGLIEWSAIPTSTQGQPYGGHGIPITLPSGQSIFATFSLRLGTGFNASGAGDVWTDKFMIWGQGADSRVICHLAPSTGITDVWLWCSQGIAAYPQGTQRVQLTVGQLHKVQLEVKSSQLKLWLDNGTYASPTSQSGSISVATQTWSLLGIGFYHNARVSSSGRVDLTYGDVVLRPTFDPNWR